MNKSIISMINVEKIYGTNHVVKNMNMTIYEGEFLTLLGPSGCGKTTTLRMIAGFETASYGIIMIQNERVDEREPYERDVNTVFQNYALFPFMTVFDNIAFGLKLKKVSKDEIKKRVKEMLSLVQLEGYEKRKPAQLSGGQRQRVAIARALINRPNVLLLDEPLGALDLKLRKQMQVELKRLQRKLGITFVYVTHDQEEALTMSDRIAIINNGVLEQIDTPDRIYEYPNTKFVAGFIGESNVFEGVIKQKEENVCQVAVESGMIPAKTETAMCEERVFVSVRPEDTEYSKNPVEGFQIPAMVKEFIYAGQVFKTIVTLSTGEEIIIVRFQKDREVSEGDILYLYWDLDKAVTIRTDRN
ncbi:MAG: ABC transporter ATP-binding protein [Lachnospiraceae bacterium]